MAAATWGLVSPPTRQTRTGATTFADVPDAVIPSSNFIAGKKYLLLVTAVTDQNGTNAVAYLQARHGTTDFAGSLHAEEPDVATTSKMQYAWWTVWEAVAVEDVLLRFATTPSTGEVGVDQIQMFWLKLSDDFEEGVDWSFNENTTLTALTATQSTTNNASITFTPAVAGQRWWIVGGALDDHSPDAPAFYSFQHRLNRTGEATETTDEVIKETEDINDGQYVSLVSCVKTLAAVSQTFFVGSLLSTTGVAGDNRLASSVFALNLEKFAQFIGEYTAAGVDLSATAYATNLATGTITPAGTDDVFVFGKFNHNANNVSVWGKGRIQLDNTDVVANTTSEAYNLEDVHDGRDQCTIAQLGVVTGVTAAAHTVDLDGSVEAATAGRNALYRTLVAFTKELVAVGEPVEQTLSAGVEWLLGVRRAVIDAAEALQSTTRSGLLPSERVTRLAPVQRQAADEYLFGAGQAGTVSAELLQGLVAARLLPEEYLGPVVGQRTPAGEHRTLVAVIRVAAGESLVGVTGIGDPGSESLAALLASRSPPGEQLRRVLAARVAPGEWLAGVRAATPPSWESEGGVAVTASLALAMEHLALVSVARLLAGEHLMLVGVARTAPQAWLAGATRSGLTGVEHLGRVLQTRTPAGERLAGLGMSRTLPAAWLARIRRTAVLPAEWLSGAPTVLEAVLRLVDLRIRAAGLSDVRAGHAGLAGVQVRSATLTDLLIR